MGVPGPEAGELNQESVMELVQWSQCLPQPGLELEPQQQVGLGPPGLSRDSRVLIVRGDDGALGRCQLALRAAVGSLPYLLASSLQLACLAAAVPGSLPPSSSSPLPARLPPCPTSELRV